MNQEQMGEQAIFCFSCETYHTCAFIMAYAAACDFNCKPFPSRPALPTIFTSHWEECIRNSWYMTHSGSVDHPVNGVLMIHRQISPDFLKGFIPFLNVLSKRKKFDKNFGVIFVLKWVFFKRVFFKKTFLKFMIMKFRSQAPITVWS